MSSIRIDNLKNITELDFVIPSTEVHVLTGTNGCGKTTLLTCLQRITDSYAFQRHFKTSSNSQFDNFQSAAITYTHNQQSVKYIYRNTRWSPNPRKGAGLLKQIGFAQTIYISSSVERFYVQNEELDTRGISAASAFFKDSMNEVFETDKYNELRRVKLSGKGRGYGRWNYGFLMPAKAGTQNRYYTEKNFSLGEVLVLNALFELNFAKDNSLLLIDEVELALHPRVQVKLLKFLERISSDKNLTVIISTHSSSLIKAASHLIYLERNRNNGKVSVEYDCYPAIALQNVAVQEEVQPDIVFFVEDKIAKFLLEEMIAYYFKNLNHGRRPIMKILPVGGWENTIKLAESSAGYLIPANCAVYAVLDADVQTTINAIQAKANRTEGEQGQLHLYNNNLNRIKFLPITPELGIVQLLTTTPQNHIQPLQDHFNGVFDISQIILDEAQQPGIVYPPNPRKAAKKRLDFYVERVRQATNRELIQVKIMLAQYYINSFGPANQGQILGLLNPIFQ